MWLGCACALVYYSYKLLYIDRHNAVAGIIVGMTYIIVIDGLMDFVKARRARASTQPR
jgi:hypothetical protein